MTRTMQSPYMHWAKTKQWAPYNLAISGMIPYPLASVPLQLSDLEINGPNSYGYRPLHEEIAKRYRVTTANIVTTFGTSMANFLALSALVNPGDKVLFEHPVYELITSAAGNLGARIEYFKRRVENSFLLDPVEIRRGLASGAKVVVLTNLHNPTSAYTGRDTLKEIVAAAAEHGATVIVDEVYLDAMFDAAPETALTLGENVVVTNSLTKIYGVSGVRCGWILAQPALATAIWRMIDIIYGAGTFPPDVISTALFRNLPSVAARSRAILDANHTAINAFLDSRDDLETVRPKFGTVFFPRSLRADVDKLEDLLRSNYETSIVNGRFFDMPGWFRLGVCGDPQNVAEGLRRLGLALDELR